MNLSAQLTAIRDTLCGHSTPRMAETVGMSRNQLANYISGKSMSDRMAQRIARAFPSVNPDWLLTGAGDMLLIPDDSATHSLIVQLAQRDTVIASQQRTIERLVAMLGDRNTE